MDLDTFVVIIICLFLGFICLFIDFKKLESQKIETLISSDKFIVYDECYFLDSKYYCFKED